MAKLYKVTFSKKFHSMTPEGVTFTHRRHSRAGISLSFPGEQEYVGELTDEQVEAITNDPAFEITTVKSDESKPSSSNSKPSTGKPAQTAQNTPKTGEDKTGEQTQTTGGEDQGGDQGSQDGDGQESGDQEGSESGDKSGEGESEVAETRKELLKQNRDVLVAKAKEAGVEVADTDSKAQIADKLLAKTGEQGEEN